MCKLLQIVRARNLVENNRVKILLNPHLFGKKDNYTFDKPGLDHILAASAHQNKIAIAFTMKSIKTPLEMNWVMKSIKLCRKYKVRMLFFSYAESKYEMAGKEDFLSLLKVLGLTGKEAKEALSLENN